MVYSNKTPGQAVLKKRLSGILQRRGRSIHLLEYEEDYMMEKKTKSGKTQAVEKLQNSKNPFERNPSLPFDFDLEYMCF